MDQLTAMTEMWVDVCEKIMTIMPQMMMVMAKQRVEIQLILQLKLKRQ